MKYFTIILCFTIYSLLTSCSSQKINQTNSDKLYKKENNKLTANFNIYHINDSISKLFFEISNETLLYKKADTSAHLFCNVSVLIKIKPEDNLNSITDSQKITIIDKQTDLIVKNLKGNLLFKLKNGANYLLDIKIIDNNKKTTYTQNVYSDKSSNNTRQNFLVTNEDDAIQFSPYFNSNEIIFLQSETNREKTYAVDYFKSNFEIARPPFSTEAMPQFTYKPDSTFTIYLIDERLKIKLPSKGFYHLKTNNETKEGITFFNYESGFPKIKTTEQMIMSTRYIMTKKEFDNAMYSADKKEAIDKFWLEIGGSNERAKELIKKYYGRIQEANRFFTSYQEGWKTDRGMIYTIFGAPNTITKQKNGELWIYGEINNPNSITFPFVKVINPFTDNDYYLERSELFKIPWYQAVDMWRQGRIYIDN